MTAYKILVTGVQSIRHPPERQGAIELTVVLPTTSEEVEWVAVSREDGQDLVGVELAHGGVVAGHWPDGEEWVDEIRVANPLGHFAEEEA